MLQKTHLFFLSSSSIFCDQLDQLDHKLSRSVSEEPLASSQLISRGQVIF
jgi:hypothetical protein